MSVDENKAPRCPLCSSPNPFAVPRRQRRRGERHRDLTVFLASPAIPRILLSGTMREFAMAVNQEKTSKIPIDDATDNTGPRDVKIDRTAPAGSENSLGAQSVRDGRPATDDSVVEAMDEEDPGISPIDPEKKER
jgi:hypothetical protein